MTKLSGCSGKLFEREGRRERVESLWELYLTWRNRDGQAAKQRCVHERPTSGFLRLCEIEATALDVFRPYLSEEIPYEFVVALMRSTANATSRFMLANPTHADRYRRLGFQSFWGGLAAMEVLKEGKQRVLGESETHA